MEHYKKLESKFKDVKTIENISGILSWDNEVMMPKGSVESRTEQLSYLSKLSYDIITSDKVGELIENVNTEQLSKLQYANFKEIKRIRQNNIDIPLNLLQKFQKSSIHSELIWRNACQNNDFELLLPSLKETFTLAKSIAEIKSEILKCDVYEACVDTFDPGMKISFIDNIFNELEEFLPNFIGEAINRQNAIKTSINLSMDTETQIKLSRRIMKDLGFNFEQGRIDVSQHPFCGGISEDIRITTRYDTKNFLSGIMGIIHETGHAIYEQNLPREWIYQPLTSINSKSIHESQSLLYEMQIGRSIEFSEYLHKILFDEAKIKIDHKDIYRILNRISRSHIRVDADEATYPLHIIIRYKIEKALFKGELQVEDIPTVWNEYTQKLLLLIPSNHSEGCLQDIHWPSGCFGYFPSYSIGAIMSSQFFYEINKDISPDNIREGNFKPYLAWLQNKIYQYGNCYNPIELMQHVSNKDNFDIANYKNCLYQKFIKEYT